MNRPHEKTAAEDVAATCNAIKDQLAELKMKLAAVESKAAARPMDWSFASSFRKVEADLDSLIDFLS